MRVSSDFRQAMRHTTFKTSRRETFMKGSNGNEKNNEKEKEEREQISRGERNEYMRAVKRT